MNVWFWFCSFIVSLDLASWIFSVDHCCSWRSSLRNTDEPSGQTFSAFPGAERSAACSCSVLVPPEAEEVLTVSFPLTRSEGRLESPHHLTLEHLPSPVCSSSFPASKSASTLESWSLLLELLETWPQSPEAPPALLLLISEALQTSRRLLQQSCRASILLLSGCLTSSAQLCSGLISVCDCDLH